MVKSCNYSPAKISARLKARLVVNGCRPVYRARGRPDGYAAGRAARSRRPALTPVGLVPWWAKDIKMGARCINAMAETVATKPPFRDAFPRRQRCIVPRSTLFTNGRRCPPASSPTRSWATDGLALAMAACGNAGRIGVPVTRSRLSPSLHRPQRALWRHP